MPEGSNSLLKRFEGRSARRPPDVTGWNSRLYLSKQQAYEQGHTDALIEMMMFPERLYFQQWMVSVLLRKFDVVGPVIAMQYPEAIKPFAAMEAVRKWLTTPSTQNQSPLEHLGLLAETNMLMMEENARSAARVAVWTAYIAAADVSARRGIDTLAGLSGLAHKAVGWALNADADAMAAYFKRAQLRAAWAILGN